jgi:hypothetical protein
MHLSSVSHQYDDSGTLIDVPRPRSCSAGAKVVESGIGYEIAPYADRLGELIMLQVGRFC